MSIKSCKLRHDKHSKLVYVNLSFIAVKFSLTVSEIISPLFAVCTLRMITKAKAVQEQKKKNKQMSVWMNSFHNRSASRSMFSLHTILSTVCSWNSGMILSLRIDSSDPDVTSWTCDVFKRFVLWFVLIMCEATERLADSEVCFMIQFLNGRNVKLPIDYSAYLRHLQTKQNGMSNGKKMGHC